MWITSEYLHDQIILSAKYNDKESVCEKKKSVIGFEVVPHIHELKLATNCVCVRKTLIQVHTLELCRWFGPGSSCVSSLLFKSRWPIRLFVWHRQVYSKWLINGAVFCSYRSIGSTPCLRTLFAHIFWCPNYHIEIDKPYLGHDKDPFITTSNYP